MKYVISCLILVSFYAQNFAHADAEASCECPKLACDPCSAEKGVTFFTDKCGPGLARMKSCARPTCVPIELATKECPVPPTAGGTRTPIVVAEKKQEVAREPASGDSDVASIGKVKVLQGSVSVVGADGKAKVIDKEASLQEGDRIESGKDGGAVVNFEGGNKLHIQPDSTVEIKEFKNQASAESRKALLNLIKGKVRSQVGQKYKGDKQSYYRIMTRAAVAGVRGTDFITSYSESDKMDTRIETLGGKVELMNMDESDKRVLMKGDSVSYVADMPAGDSAGVMPGKFTEMMKLSDDEMKALDKGTRMDVARVGRKTASESTICEKPRAAFNQCMWKCVGNPDGSKVCRTELPQVRCVRSRCNANGDWAEESRVPAAASQALCPSAGTLVKDCDY